MPSQLLNYLDFICCSTHNSYSRVYPLSTSICMVQLRCHSFYIVSQLVNLIAILFSLFFQAFHSLIMTTLDSVVQLGFPGCEHSPDSGCRERIFSPYEHHQVCSHPENRLDFQAYENAAYIYVYRYNKI